MTELEPTITDSTIARMTAPRAHPPLAASRTKPRWLRKTFVHAWIHLFLLTGIAIFLFPFVYMLATSLKTDEELTSTSWFPSLPRYESTSPRVRDTQPPQAPAEVPATKWEMV